MNRYVLLTVLACAGSASAATRQHTLSIVADGRDELRIADGALRVEHGSWGAPSDLTIDGVAHPLAFTGSTSQAIPVPITGDHWARRTAGRDGAYAVQRADGFALAVVDNPNGSDTYSFDLYDAPLADSIEWMRVRAAGATPGRMSLQGVPGYAPTPAGSVMTFSLTIDGTVDLMFADGALVMRHISWPNPPSSVTVDGVLHPVTWNNLLSSPIPVTLPDQFQFTQAGGRVVLYPVETPVGLLVGAADELLGSNVYTFSITAVPEPTLGAVALVGVATMLTRRRRRVRR